MMNVLRCVSSTQALLDAGYEPVFVEVLSFKFVNSSQLVDALRRGEEHSGLVFTSQTAVSAVAHCVSEGVCCVCVCVCACASRDPNPIFAEFQDYCQRML